MLESFFSILQINQIRYCLDTLLLTSQENETSQGLKENSKRELLLKIKTQIVW